MQQQSFVLRETQSGREYLIPPEGLRIGRMAAHEVSLDDGQVSRTHAKLWVQENQLYIQDEGSTNGTWVNDQRISKPTSIQPGDKVRTGNTVFEVTVKPIGVVPARVSQAAPEGVPIVPIVIVGGVVLLILISVMLRRVVLSPHTPTVIPSAVPTELPTEATAEVATPEPTPTETVIPTSPPVPAPVTQTPGMRYSAPSLIDPQEGGSYRGPSPMPYPVLKWTSVGDLGQDEFYRVVIDYPHDGAIWQDVGFTKDVQWRVPDYLYSLLSDPRECRWHIEVVYVTVYGVDGTPSEFIPISPPSETRMFTWHQGGGGDGSSQQPTATPTLEVRP